MISDTIWQSNQFLTPVQVQSRPQKHLETNPSLSICLIEVLELEKDRVANLYSTYS